MRSPTDRNAISRGLVCASLKQSLNLPLELGERRRHDAGTGIDDNLPSGARPVELRSKGLAHSSLDAIPNHGSSQSSGAGKTDPHALDSIISQAEGGEKWPGELGAMIIDFAKVARTKEAGALGETGDSPTSRG